MAERAAKRLLIVGWDAADWQVIDPLIAAGEMPHLKRLIDGGVRSDLATLEPKLSPLLWTSIATGRTPDLHGILNFVEPKPDGSGLRVASSTSRRVKSLWNIASQSGLRTQVTSWYASHPAEPVHGSITSNLFLEGDPGQRGAAWPLQTDCVHPTTLADAVAAARVGRADFLAAHLKEILPKAQPTLHSDERVQSLAKLMAVAASVDGAARVAMSATPWDLAMVFFETIDTVGHLFMQYRPPRMKHVSDQDLRQFGQVMNAVYRWHDSALGRLLDTAGTETTVLLCSDHGFHSGAQRPMLADLPPERRMEKEASWHRPVGILVAAGPGIKPKANTVAASILDIAPTALALLNLPAALDFGGRAIAEILTCSVPERIPSWEEREGDAGLHPPDARQDPFEAADAVQHLVDLGYMAALPATAKDQIELVRRESAFNLGVNLLSRGKPRSALPHLQSLVDTRPDERRYISCLAAALVTSGAFDEAIQLLEHACAAHPTDAELQLLLARACIESGKTAEGARILSSVEAAARNDGALLQSLGRIQLHAGMHDAALATAKRLTSTSGKTPVSLMLAAEAHLGKRDWEAAGQAALDAMDVSPAIPDAHWILGMALAFSGDLENAARSFDLGMQFDKHHLACTESAAVVAAARGKQEDADALRAAAQAIRKQRENFIGPPLPYDAAALAAALTKG
jgi:predicted AlkP superfamily phosphohydrolase/phosphomutase/Flp pilus assembly protein TadD